MFFLTLVAVVSLQTVGTIFGHFDVDHTRSNRISIDRSIGKMIFISATVGVLSAIIGVVL